MDFWELTKLLVRRWYIAAPLVLVSLLATVYTAKTVKPDYSSTGYVQLIPPANAPEAADKAGRVRNPWADLGVDALGQAVMITVRKQDVLDTLEKQGYSINFTVTMVDRSPIITIAVIGKTPAQASSTVLQIAKLIDQNVKTQQQQYRVQVGDSITTLTLDDGGNVETVGSKVKRALIVVAAVGLLLSAATTIALDAMLRRRSRRRAATAKAEVAAGADPPTPPKSDASATAQGEPAKKARTVRQRTSPATVSSPLVPDDDNDATTRISVPEGVAGSRVTNGRPAAGAGPAARKPPVTVHYQRSGVERLTNRAERDEAEPGDSTSADRAPVKRDIPEDATIVLPLSSPKWWNREPKGKQS